MFLNIGILGLILIFVIVFIIFGFFKLLEIGCVVGWILLEFKSVIKLFVFGDEKEEKLVELIVVK